MPSCKRIITGNGTFPRAVGCLKVLPRAEYPVSAARHPPASGTRVKQVFYRVLPKSVVRRQGPVDRLGVREIEGAGRII